MQSLAKINHVVVNVGVGKRRDDSNFLAAVKEDLGLITGQSPQERRSRQSIAGFKMREGNLVGYRVTLRGKRRDDFVKRFVGATLPRVRDFRGISESSLDSQGNLNVGIKEQLAFPEILPEKTDYVFPMQVTFVSTVSDREQAKELFKSLNFPYGTTS